MEQEEQKANMADDEPAAEPEPEEDAADDKLEADQQQRPQLNEAGIKVNNMEELTQAVVKAKDELLEAKKTLKIENNEENNQKVVKIGLELVKAQMALAEADPPAAAAAAAAAAEAAAEADVNTDSDPLKLDYLIKSIYSLTIKIKDGDENLNNTLKELRALLDKMNDKMTTSTVPLDDMTNLNLAQSFFLFQYLTEMGIARQQPSTNGANAEEVDDASVTNRGGRYKSRRRRKKHNSRKTHRKKHRKTHKKKHRKTRKTHKKKHRKNYKTRKM